MAISGYCLVSDADFHASHAGLVEQVGRICPVPGMLESWLHQPLGSLGNISMWWLFEFV